MMMMMTLPVGTNENTKIDDDLNQSKLPFEYAFRIQRLCKGAEVYFECRNGNG